MTSLAWDPPDRNWAVLGLLWLPPATDRNTCVLVNPRTEPGQQVSVGTAAASLRGAGCCEKQELTFFWDVKLWTESHRWGPVHGQLCAGPGLCLEPPSDTGRMYGLMLLEPLTSLAAFCTKRSSVTRKARHRASAGSCWNISWWTMFTCRWMEA